MKRLTLIVCIGMAILALNFSISGAEEVATTVPLPQAPEDLLASALVSVAVSHPWLTSFMLAIGVLRSVFKPLVSAIEWHVARTSSKKDDEILNKVEASKGWKFLCWMIDFLSSVKLGRPTR